MSSLVLLLCNFLAYSDPCILKKRLLTYSLLFFSWVSYAQSPGGVSTDLQGWYKADAGTNTTVNGGSITSWNDQSAAALNLAEANGGGTPQNPTYQSVVVNYNPAIRFTDPGNTNYSFLTSTSNPLTQAMTLIVIFATTQNEGGSAHWDSPAIIGADHGNTGNNYALGMDDGRLHAKIESGDSYGAQTTGTYNDGTPHLALATRVVSGNTILYVDGLSVATDASDGATLNDPDAVAIGNQESASTATQFAGDVCEVILYSDDLTAAEQSQVQSYLALKYGITLDNSGGGTAGDLVNSGSTTIWDASTNSTYHNAVAGIGRDDNSALNQKQSASITSTSMVNIGLGSIAASNAANSNTFSADNSFMIWGDNNGSLTFSTTGAPTGKQILGRVWKVAETGTVGTVQIQVPDNSSSATVKLPSAGAGGTVSLVVDSDGDFTSGATVTSMTLNGTNWEATVDLSDGDFFTFVQDGAVLSVTTNGNEEGPVDIVYTVTLPTTNNSGSTLTFDFDDAGTGSATSGSDYTAIGGSDQISVANGSQTGTYTVSVTDDGAQESVEDFVATISNPSDASVYIQTSSATATITDNDGKSPGGYSSGLVYWFKANSGTNTTTDGSAVTDWVDQSGNGNDGFDISTNDPLFQSVLNNFNPSLDYTSTSASGGIGLSDNSSINTGASSAKAYSIVFRTGSDITTRQVLYEEGGGTHGMNLYIESGNVIGNLWQSSADRTGSTALSTNTDYILTFVYDGGNTRWDMYLNGTLAASNTSATSSLPAHSDDIGIGVINGGTQFNGNNDVSGNNGFSGYIMEMAYYNGVVPSSTDRNQLESYLSLKYGIDINTDLTASDGTTVFWDESANTSNANNVTGIGWDDNSGLIQKQATSINPEGMVTIGLNSIATSNALNSGSFSVSNSFMTWGNDGGSVTFSTTGAPSGKMILGREWKVQETGTVGTVRVQVPGSASSASVKLPLDAQMLIAVDTDGDFSSGATFTSMTQNGNDWEADVDFSNGDFFTFVVDGAVLASTTQGDEDGPVNIVYTVTLPYLNTSGSPITFDFDDAGTGTATSGSDYTAISPTAQISVANNAQTGTITVVVSDDGTLEATETVIATISNSSDPNLAISVASATAVINDNEATNPGGLSSNLIFWYKADAGTNTTVNGAVVSSLNDQTSTGANASESGSGLGPLYTSVLANFNPALDFGSVTGGLDMPDVNGVNQSGPFTAKSYTIAFRTGADITTRQMLYEQGGGGTGMNIYVEAGELRTNMWTGSTENNTAFTLATNTDYVATYIWDGTNTTCDIYVNGVAGTGFTGSLSSLNNHGGDPGIGLVNGATQYVGDISSSGGEPFDGYFMELAYFNDLVFTSAQQDQLESYMALKYGVSINQNYIASDGSTTYWNITTNSGYNNAIVGIGQDVNTNLNQKQSISSTSDALLSIGLDTIVADNASNAKAFAADLNFFVMGHNGGAVTFTNSGAPAGTLILNRKWKVQETGTVGSIKIQAPASTSSATTKLPAANSLFLVVDSDDDFTNGYTSLTEMTLNGTNWEGEIDFSTGQYFSFISTEANLSVTTNGSETGPVNIVFTVTLNATNDSGGDITFDLADLGTGTATSGSDYTAIPGGAQITIANGQSSGTYTVVVSDDNFDETDETVNVQISNPSGLAINIVTATASATITDDDVSAPAGVSSNLVFWLKANLGTSTTTDGGLVGTWFDQTSGSNNATTSVTAPLYDDVVSNFNPGVDFSNSSTGGFTMANTDDINSLGAGYTAKSYVIAFRTGSDVSTRQLIYEQGGATNGMNLYIESGNLYANIWNNSADNAASTAISANTTYVVTYVFDGGNTRWDMYVNGTLAASDATAMGTLLTHTGAIGLGVIVNDTEFDGNVDVGSGEGFLGSIMEMIYYNGKVFTSGERNQLESYLAVKYGVSMTTNYTASDGTTTFWDATANATYLNDVTGLAGDGTSVLDQKQSVSSNSDGLLTIGLGSIAADNASNSNTFTLGEEFLMWGNNNGTLGGVSSNSSLTAQSGDADLLQRVWKIVETGTIGTVQVAVPKTTLDGYFTYSGSGNFALKIADDASFTTNVQYITLSETSINSVTHYAANHDFSGTKFMTIAQREAIIWTGTEWRGGLSSSVDHGPSSIAGDASKTLYIFSGSDANVTEGVIVTNVEVAASSTLNMNPATCLIISGTFTNNGSFNLLADATGYAQYKGPAVGGTLRQYIANEGWHLIGSPFSDVQWEDLGFLNGNGFINHPLGGVSLDTCIYCNLWYYDPSTDNGNNIGFGGTNAYGTWRSSTSSSENFDATKGWNLYLDAASGFSSAPWTVEISGTFTAGNVSQSVNENNGGWNLVANPYPSSIDWNTVDDDLATAGIALGYHVWDHANSNYATYSASGGGTLGATQYIPPFQGFYVQTAVEGTQGSGNVLRNFELTDGDRPDACQTSGVFFKTQSSDRIVIRSRHRGSGKIDETILAFNEDAVYDFDRLEDIRKLFTRGSGVTSIYGRFGGESTSIALLPPPEMRDSTIIGVRAANGAGVTLEIAERPGQLEMYLEDRLTGVFHDLSEPYNFVQDSRFQDRFVLHFGTDVGEVEFEEEPFSAYINADKELVFEIDRRVTLTGAEWQLYSVAGSLVREGNIAPDSGTIHTSSVSGIRPGVYVISFVTNGERHTQKIPIL